MVQCLLIIAHLQIDPGSESLASSLASIEYIERLLGKIGQCLVDVLQDKVVDGLHRRLCVSRSDIGASDQWYTAIVGRRCSIVGLGIVVDEGKILHGPQNLGLRHGLIALRIGGVGCCGCVLDDEIGNGDACITIVVGCLVALIHHDTVGTLVPVVVGVPQLIVGQITSRDKPVVEQYNSLRHILAAVVIFIGEHGREVLERGRNLLPLGHIAQIVVATSQRHRQGQACHKETFAYDCFHSFAYFEDRQ